MSSEALQNPVRFLMDFQGFPHGFEGFLLDFMGCDRFSNGLTGFLIDFIGFLNDFKGFLMGSNTIVKPSELRKRRSYSVASNQEVIGDASHVLWIVGSFRGLPAMGCGSQKATGNCQTCAVDRGEL